MNALVHERLEVKSSFEVALSIQVKLEVRCDDPD
jgi:hypothetical protein